MEIKYRCERDECYMLVAAGEIRADHYQLRMLEHNRIDGLLKVGLQQINRQSEFCYTISGRQSLAQRYENACISTEEIKKLMAALNKTTGQLEEFLLNIDSLWLEPEWIYWKADGDGLPEFCYYPEEVPEKSFRERVRTLLQYLLNKIDHKDPAAVNVAYSLYQIGMKETFSMQELMQFLFYGIEENEELDEAECLQPGLWEGAKRGTEDAKRKTEDAYETADCDMPDDNERSKRQKQKQRQSLGRHRPADYVLTFLVVALALAAVLRLAFLWYGRREAMSEKEVIIHIGLICAIIVVSGLAIYKLMAKTDAEAAAVWESPEEAGDCGQEQEYGRKQGTFAEECPAVKPRNRRENAYCDKNSFQWENVSESRNTPLHWKNMSEQSDISNQGTIQAQGNMPDQGDFPEATCVLTGISDSLTGGWRFRYQGTEESIKDFFLYNRERQVMVGKKLKAPDIALNWPTVSRHHAVFQIRNGICMVRDCGSTNGTYLDGNRLGREEMRVLLPGSELKFADVVFRVEETVRDENATTVLTAL